jgi:hypothetical protein
MKANLHIHTHFPLLPQANGSAAGMQHLFNSGPSLESLHLKANLHIHTHFPLLPQANGSAAGMQHLFNSGPEEPADFITEVRGDEEGLLGENDSRPDSAMHGLPLKRECVRVCLRVMCVMCV